MPTSKPTCINEPRRNRTNNRRHEASWRMDCNRIVYRHYWLAVYGQSRNFTGGSSREAAVAGNGDQADSAGTNLETIMENQKQLLDLRDRIAEVEKTTSRTICWFNNSKKKWTAQAASRKSTVRLMISEGVRRSV